MDSSDVFAGAHQAGRFTIVQSADPALPILVDTLTGRTWFRIKAGSDEYAWRPMRFEAAASAAPEVVEQPKEGSRAKPRVVA
jgi:hypothetical protein